MGITEADSGSMKIFDFGANWADFSEQHVDSQRLAIAARSIQDLLQRPALTGLRILDIGCGSGLFSIAAHQLGASVTGVDINPRCIEVSQRNAALLAPESAIRFQLASALDERQMADLGSFDLVYAWGSLHHTGSMWRAIELAADRVQPSGTLVLAIYNTHVTSPIWREIKRIYNQAPEFVQRLMAIIFAGIIYVAKFMVTRSNPLEKERGMDFWYDVIDWIGGYPYEYATIGQIAEFMRTRGFRLVRVVPAQVPTGCNEFVFERIAL
jgi:2-polyprenyl-6-hydroxyphenyl methylase/3-demethylubiquinone-9 3-methyltransferase